MQSSVQQHGYLGIVCIAPIGAAVFVRVGPTSTHSLGVCGDRFCLIESNSLKAELDVVQIEKRKVTIALIDGQEAWIQEKVAAVCVL